MKFHYRPRTHSTPWTVLGSKGGGVQDDENDVKMLFRP